jgi:palmitoyltransferase
VPPYHPDYEPAQDWQDDAAYQGQHDRHDDDGDDDDDDDDGERFAEYEYEYERRTARVRQGSEGYEVRAIDREQLLAEYIASRADEAGHYRRYVPEPASETESEGGGGDVAGRGKAEAEDEEGDDEPLAVRVEKWRSGEAIS